MLKAFRSPVVIQKRWGEKLADAVQRDPDGVVARANALIGSPDVVAPAAVFELLLGLERKTTSSLEVRGDDGAMLASLRRKGTKGFEVQLHTAKLTDALLDKVLALLGKQLKP